MNTPTLLIAIAASLVVSFGISGVCLWIIARCYRLSNVGIGRAMGTMLLLTIMNVVVDGAFLGLSAALFPSMVAAKALLALAAFAVMVLAGFAIIKKMFRAGTGKAWLVFITNGVLTGVIAFAFAAVMRADFIEAFVVPTGSSAPTVYGQHFDVKCFNCGYRFAISDTNDGGPPDQRGPQLAVVCPNCGQMTWLDRETHSIGGDRVLVDKTTAPRRWDIAAFKAPKEPNAIYIKHVVALPGETLDLAGGHVYVDGIEIHKGPDAQTDFWIPVNDTHFAAATPVSEAMHWEAAAGSHWKSKDGRWSCSATNDDALALHGKITDSLAYNEPFARQMPDPIAVGDIKLEVAIGSLSGSGGVAVHWAFGGRRFDVEIGANGDAALEASPVGKAPRAVAAASKCTLSKPLAGQMLAVAVRDGRGYLLENGRTAGSVAIEDERLSARGGNKPDAKSGQSEPCRLSISGRNCDVVLSRIALFRDIYFRSASEMGPQQSTGPGPYKLGQDEYFVIGENVAMSRDSRSFGPIKAAAMVGVARWIYWPARRWHAFQ